MATTLTSFSQVPLTSVSQQLYQVPVGKTAIILNIVIAPVGDAAKVYLYRRTVSGVDVVLLPDKAITANDVYSPPLDKLILLAGEKLFARAVLQATQPRAIAWIGIPAVFPISGAEIAHISISVAEKT
jgi:hypothetical protein